MGRLKHSKSIFCHPYSPQEKGICENTNYLIRDILGEITDFRKLNQRRVSQIVKKLNGGHRKTLNFLEHKETLFELR